MCSPFGSGQHVASKKTPPKAANAAANLMDFSFDSMTIIIALRIRARALHGRGADPPTAGTGQPPGSDSIAADRSPSEQARPAERRAAL